MAGAGLRGRGSTRHGRRSRGPRLREVVVLPGVALFLSLASGCAREPELEAPPPELAGLELHHSFTGSKALEALRRLHGGEETGMRSAWIAHYGAESPSAMLYVGAAEDDGEAAGMLDEMRRGIAAEDTPYRLRSGVRLRMGDVYVMTGQGQLHFLFRDGGRVIWLAADPPVAHEALQELSRRLLHARRAPPGTGTRTEEAGARTRGRRAR